MQNLDSLQKIIEQLSELSKLLNKGTSLKLEVNGLTWYAVRDIDKFEKEIFQRHTQRIASEMCKDINVFWNGVGREIHLLQSSAVAPQPTKLPKGTLLLVYLSLNMVTKPLTTLSKDTILSITK